MPSEHRTTASRARNSYSFELRRRSIAKAVSYRFFSSVMTGTVVWLLTRQVGPALAVGIFEVTVKVGLFFIHERIWIKIPYGKIEASGYEI
jgi:adenylylsulfate kinase